MGLDNGIYIKDISGKHGKIIQLLFHNGFDGVNQCDIVYMRKWWGVRDEIVSKFRLPQNDSDTILTIDNIKTIIKILKKYDNKDTWGYNGSPIWDYEEDNIHKHIRRHIKRLKRLLFLVKHFKGIECHFYDSY